MVSSLETGWQSLGVENSHQIRESKIVHKSPILHPLARFITEEAVASLFDISVDEIYKITCWRYVVHVHGKKVSRFVSYADFPPILAVNPPTERDFALWRKRWRRKPAQEFWRRFYTDRFNKAQSHQQLREWKNLVATLKSLFSETAWRQMEEVYGEKKSLLAG